MADTFAPVSMSAYVGRCLPLCLTDIGTMGRVAPFRPTYALNSHSLSSEFESLSIVFLPSLFCCCLLPLLLLVCPLLLKSLCSRV